MTDPTTATAIAADPYGTIKTIATIASPIIAFVALCVSGYISRKAILTPQRDRESKNHLDQAILSMQRAHGALTNEGRDEFAKPDRGNWLRAARHIETYKTLKQGITEPSHKVMCEDHEEYWRHRVYEAIDMYALRQPGWYDEDRVNKRSQLEPRSLIIVYGFASWPDDKIDPIAVADISAIAANHDVRKGNHGLRTYLEQFQVNTLLDAADAKRKPRPKQQ
ncbi:hypothetical protein KTD19_07835 [Burkholderia multivorans]|uniref:hypothetical protein n=1 Tax=Burkholderia multivorans TaxID=87883 RepID=UPI0012DF71F8|nr:hypothetical protein [Burkholderia multivorans]MBU9232299.1 hypothetical protein [Burkholderia multivorans]QGR93014.1 hypothetical protein FOC30_18970 [Burkholderia multivorans]HEF4738876.1 hypothetical protein [Burkholderia multivorans]